MELTAFSVISLVTFIIGFISKKLKIVAKKYIPLQNVVIGIISGFIVYFAEIETSIFRSIVLCLIGSLSAGGAYDALKIGDDKNKDE